jgi:mono/diheme cytochrome c family protein
MVPRTTANTTTRSKLGAGARGVTILAAALLAHATATFAQDDAKVKAGMEVWKSSGCADCHGSFANGEKQRDESPSGPSLRTAKLDAAALKLVVSCGRPGGSGMPAFDEGAYKIRACYDRPLGAAPDNLYPTPRTLNPGEIDAVVAYLQARIIGRGRITREECLTYYEGEPDWCEDIK